MDIFVITLFLRIGKFNFARINTGFHFLTAFTMAQREPSKEAAVKLIREVGYSNLTFQQLAKNAKTSRSVLYRRWPNMFELLMEIVDDRSAKALGGRLIDRIENTGTLRGDLLNLLTLYQKIYTEVGPEILSAVLFEIGQGNSGIPEAETALTLPFSLIRIENLMHKNVDSTLIGLIVDEILLPVFSRE